MGKGSTTTVQNNDPWSGQQPYLKAGFAEAQNIYNWQKQQPLYQGDFTATASDAAKNAMNNSLNWTNSMGNNVANSSYGYGLSNAQSGLNNTAASSGMLRNMANTDYTGQNIASASQYANNPFMSQMVDAATTDARRNLTENVLPTIDREAAGSGNGLSSRAGIAAGIADRGYQDVVANTSAQLRGDAWNSGLTAAQNDAQMRQSAAQALGSLGMGQTQAGLQGISGASDINAQNTQAGVQAATMQNAQDQAALDNSLAKYDYNMYAPSDLLNNYWQMVGQNSYGGTTRTTQSGGGGGLLGGLGAMAQIGSLFTGCDRRIKADIKRIGELACGIPLYTFRYVWEDKNIQRVGPMAQEVMEVYPDLVFEIDGILHIKYDEIIARSQAVAETKNDDEVVE